MSSRTAVVVGVALVASLVAGDCGTSAATARDGSRTSHRVFVRGGILRPFYPRSATETELKVAPFLIDRRPVTNAQFLDFVRANARWRRGQPSRLFVDARYLDHWAAPLRLGKDAPPLAPVTNVSWFAAKAFCASRRARLPTENEWELVGVASETAADGRRDPAWRARILGWYARPATNAPPDIGRGRPNFYGVDDLHGLVWEWVLDFNAPMLAADARESGDEERMRFCGAGALAASEKEDYASFMRLAFRSSLAASHTTRSLGFRCATDATQRGKGRKQE